MPQEVSRKVESLDSRGNAHFGSADREIDPRCGSLLTRARRADGRWTKRKSGSKNWVSWKLTSLTRALLAHRLRLESWTRKRQMPSVTW
eukprot:scaffold10109_cov144-Skeletonema_dohrnii-CCMP3373.AAC.8